MTRQNHKRLKSFNLIFDQPLLYWIMKPMQKCKILVDDKAFIMNINTSDTTQLDIVNHIQHGQFYEHETSLLFMRVLRPGDAVVDVGANAGYFSFLSAVRVGSAGRVLAIEANPRNTRQILDSIDVNIDYRFFEKAVVTVDNIAVAAEAADIMFATGGDNDSNGGIVPEKTAHDTPGANEFVIKAKPLDALLRHHGLSHLKLLKIDTEGHEVEVLRGARSLLERSAVDFIVCELNLPGLELRGMTQWTLRHLLSGYGYATFLLDHDGILPRLVPDGTEITQYWTSNILFAKEETIPRYWASIENKPAAARLVASA
ncbi:MAG: FkbM family methyltransferase [Alphaproteobacteria bacterium]